MNKFLTGSSNVFKYGAYGAPVFDIAYGIFNVMGGVKNMDPLFNQQIIAASRGISKQIDDMIEVYDILTDTVHTKSEDIHTIYSIDVEVADGSNNPAKSIEMFEAHTCDWVNSGSGSNTMKLKFCQKREQFRSFKESSKDLDCCSTNYFPLGSNRNEYKRYDAISSSDTLDGGAVLGECEGFDLLGTKIYVGKRRVQSRKNKV